MSHDVLFHRFAYTHYSGRHRPYLEVEFLNPELLASRTSRTLGLVDSGADYIVLPFSLGTAIGLRPPEPSEYKSAVGVGGNISLIPRNCRMYVVCQLHKKLYGFDEKIMWAYPDKEALDRLDALLKNLKLNQDLQTDAKDGTTLFLHFGKQISDNQEAIKKLMDKFETGVLLGRPFFANLNNLQIFQREKEEEDKCFLTFTFLKDKIVETKDIR